MNGVVHFEIPTDDLDRAKEFYTKVFGWVAQQVPGYEGFAIVQTTETGEKGPLNPGAINGDLYKRSDKAPYPSVVILVPSIDEHVKKIEEAGGTILMPKQAMGDMGFMASFKDSEGNQVGLWEAVSR